MDDGFSIHLSSNVSPDLFPDNEPSKFSTLLANEVDLSEGNWTVGVRQITYPTHVAATSHEDTINVYEYVRAYRDLFPHPTPETEDLNKFGVHIHVDQHKYPPIHPIERRIDFLQGVVNRNKYASKAFKLTYSSEKKKFSFHLYFEDTLAYMTEDMAKLLGFEDKTIFMKGSHLATKEFSHELGADKNFLDLYIYDLTVLENKKHSLVRSIKLATKTLVFASMIERAFKDTLPDRYYDNPKINFNIYPAKGEIKVQSLSNTWKPFKHHEKKIKFFAFDEATTKAYKLKPMYDYKEDTIYTFPKTKNQDHENVEVILYFDQAQDYYGGPNQKPSETYTIKMKESIKDPRKLLVPLNKHQGYKFSYDENTRRFTLQTFDKNAIKLSKSLASILGFQCDKDLMLQRKMTLLADDIPIMDRNISALYVYTNIINSVHVGDVQAPLLLACPMKGKFGNDTVHQLEFLNPTYVPLNRSKLRQIDIAIYDDAGTLVPFLYGKTIMTLHFRKM